MRPDRILARWRATGVLLLLLPVWLPAQPSTPAALQRRARVTWAEGAVSRRDVGRATLLPDTVRLRTETREVISIPAARVTRLEVSTGRHRHWWQGALIGAAIGGTIGGLAGSASHSDCDRSGGNACFFVSDRRINDVLFGAAIAGIPGTVLGTGIGALTRTDRWADSTALVRR
ncbi:MAG: hypothetical protein K2R93_14985 [Gemmatimonadaceae bacterium]|nr:hypothetical protein [Gemmatimonadaceae bacterium]